MPEATAHGLNTLLIVAAGQHDLSRTIGAILSEPKPASQGLHRELDNRGPSLAHFESLSKGLSKALLRLPFQSTPDGFGTSDRGPPCESSTGCLESRRFHLRCPSPKRSWHSRLRSRASRHCWALQSCGNHARTAAPSAEINKTLELALASYS